MIPNSYVLISYSSKDLVIVNRIISFLENNGIPYWKAPDMIPPDSTYAREIIGALQDSAYVIVLLSKNSQRSIWVEKEIDKALKFDRRILPVQIDDAPLSELFSFYFADKTIIDYKNDPKAAITELARYLIPLAGKARRLTPVTDPDALELPRANSPREGRHTSLKANSAAEKNSIFIDPDDPKESRRKKPKMIPVNFYSKNRRPECCVFCGGELVNKGKGIYPCMDCGRENFDDFTLIRRYLLEHGAAPITKIIQDLGIPRSVVNAYRDET